MLKKAGYDSLIIQGKASRPVYLWINDGQVEIKDAASFWGKDTAETVDRIREELDEPKASVADIGVAGEKLVAIACIAVDKDSYVGRDGLGAVMGSKNLKAVAVKGTQKSEVADPKRVLELAKELNQRIRENAPEAFLKGGTTICEGIQFSYFWLGQSKIGMIPLPVIILIIIFLIMDFVMTRTTFGTYNRAIGSNSEASRLAGISVNQMLLKIMAISGVCAAIAGVITASRLGVGSPVTGYMKELDSITAVILGGTAMTGGVGTIKGTFIGALVVTILTNGLTIIGVSSYWQQILLGFVLIGALALKKFQK